MKKLFVFTIVAFLAGIMSIHAQTTAKGVVKDNETGNPLPGVTVQIQGSSISVETDSKGEYHLPSLVAGNYLVTYILNGFLTVELQIEIKSEDQSIPDVLMKHNQVDEAQNQTLSEITISSDDLDMDSKGQSVSGLLQSSADPFESAVSYTFSPARYQIRGYDSDYNQVYMNGIPVNDPESGFSSWGAWGGLNDVTRNRESRYGLATSSFAFGGIGGVANINTRASQARVGTKISYASTNRTYTNRLMVTHSTGLMENGVAITLSGSRRWAEEGYVEGTFYDAYAYFISIEKKFNESHSVAFTTFNAPTKRGMQGAATEEANQLAGTNFYNPNWGYQNGEKRNSRVRNQQEPTFMLNHYWKIDEKTFLTNNIGYSFGSFGTTAINWYDAQDPRPDYYRKLPSYWITSGQDVVDQITDAFKNDVNNRQVNWDDLYQTNYRNLDANNQRRSKYIVENRLTDSKQLTLSSVLNKELSARLKLDAGAEFLIYRGRNYKAIDDLLGGDYFLDIDQFAERDFGDPILMQNDLDNPNRQVKKGDTYGYDYVANVNTGDLWAVARYLTNKLDYYFGANYEMNQFWRTGNMRNGRFPNDSKGDSKKELFNTYGLKGGTTWKITGRHFLEANVAYLTRAPFFRNSYISPRTSNFTIPGLTNERIASADINYNLRSPFIKARLSAYYTKFMDQTELKTFYFESADLRTFVNYMMTNIDKVHKGLELGVEVKASATITLNAVAGLGSYQYKSRPNVTITQDNIGTVVGERVIYIKNFYVPSTPQTAAMFAVKYASPKYWFFDASVSYFDDIYIDFAPERRTPEALSGLEPNDPLRKKITDQTGLPSAYLVDASVGKSWRIKKYYINLNFQVTNILDNTDFKTGGYEQLRNVNTEESLAKYPPRNYYSFGRTYYLNLGFRF